MNDDLISRQAVLDLINKFILEIHSEGGRDLNAHTNDVLRQILRNVKSDRVLPPVNLQEPKTGHWIYDRTRDWDGECKYECSECGMGSDVDYAYCMRCGAKMVEPQESEEV